MSSTRKHISGSEKGGGGNKNVGEFNVSQSLMSSTKKKHMLDDIDIDSIITEFVSRSVRRNSFK
jgi:hypothetical protein